MVFTLVSAMPVHAESNPVAQYVIVNNDQILFSLYPYLIDGKRSATIPVGKHSTASFDSTLGKLTLWNYNGGTISAYDNWKSDLVIELRGANTITVADAGIRTYGISSSRGGNIKITSPQEENIGFLTINISNSGIDNGINASEENKAIGIELTGSEGGNVIIAGKADVKMNVTSLGNPEVGYNMNLKHKAYGMNVPNGTVTIQDQASYKVVCESARENFARENSTCGIYALDGVTIDTTGDIFIDPIQNGGSNSSIQTMPGSASTLTKVGRMELRWQGEGSGIYSGLPIIPSGAFDSALETHHLYMDRRNRIAVYRYGILRTLTVNEGSQGSYNYNDKYLEGDIATVIAKAPATNFRFKEWQGADGLVFEDSTSKNSPLAKFKMPGRNVELTAIYEQTVFSVQPENNTSYAGNDIPFNWTISDYEGNVEFVILEIKNGEVWDIDWVMPSSYRSPGHYSLSRTSDTAGEKTYRLKYGLSPVIYSDEFTLKWLPPVIRDVIVSPTSVEVEKGKTTQFTASVTGEGNFNKEVKWSIINANSPYTEITQDGLLMVAGDESVSEITVIATAKGDLNKIRVVSATVKEPPAYVTGISISPLDIELGIGQSRSFTANVTGVNAFSDAVVWSVTGHENASISDSGYFQIYTSKPMPEGTILTVTATSVADPTISGTAKVKVVAEGLVTNVTIAPKVVTVQRGTSHNFTAAVTGTGSFSSNLLWTVSDIELYGVASTISADGLLNVPLNETRDKLIVRVQSSVSFKNDFAIVNVVGPTVITSVKISPENATVQKGSTQKFTATVKGTGIFDSKVKWLVAGGVLGTSIDSSGMLTVAAEETAPTLFIRASSNWDIYKRDQVTVTVTDAPVTRYVATINKGSGSGEYEAGNTVAIAAEPYYEDREFLEWVVLSGSVTFADLNSNITTFVMPQGPVRVEARYKNPVMTWVNINGKILNSDVGWLFDGEERLIATFDSDTGTLILRSYNGSRIEYNSTTLADLNIVLDGINTINEYGPGQKIGIWNNSGGNINITATENASLNINMNTDSEAYGIAGNLMNEITGDINISGYANINIDVKSAPSMPGNVRGIYSADGVTISDNAALVITANGRRTYGIWAGKKIVFNTDKDITIDSHGINSSHALGTWGSIKLDKVHSMTLKSYELVTYPSVTHDESKFAVNHFVADDGLNIDTYRYGTPYSVNVIKGSGGGQYPNNDMVTITANAPDEYFVFEKWEGTDGLTFVGGTSKTDAEIQFTMPARDFELTATYKDTRFNITVVNGSGNGQYLPDTTVTLIANAPKPNFKFKEWATGDSLTFVGGTSKTDAEIQFIMPSKDVALTATYGDTVFTKQPTNATGYVGESVSFNWTLDKEGIVVYALTEIYEGGTWQAYSSALGDSYKQNGSHTSSLWSDTAGTKTFRLDYYIGLSHVYSQPFTITWEEALIATGNIQGYASWGKVGDDSGIKVTAKEGDTTIAETHTGTDGGFELSLDAGIYDIVLSKSGYLERKISNVVVIQDLPTNLANNDNPISLLAGDINGDKSINANDLSVLLAAFNKTTSDAGYNEAADLNGDGSINANDLSMLLSNFNKTTSDYPEWILP